MANVCTNYITIQGDPALIKIIAEDYIGYDKEKDSVEFNFGLMAPVPADVLLANEDYQWRIDNWGNKWDGSDCYVDICDDEIHMSIETAWGPCDRWTYKLIEICPGVNIYHEYYESGCAFIGWIEHNENEGPLDHDDTEYSYAEDPHDYWVAVFDKEYETFDFLCEHIDDLVNDELLSEEQAAEVRTMIDDGTPLEILVAKCLDDEIL